MQDSAALQTRFPLSFAAGRQIDLVCDEFERGWHQGTPRPIEEYLRAAEAGSVPTLRAELLRLELECRLRRGERPGVDEYRARFPECAGALPGWLEEAVADVNAVGTAAFRFGAPSTVNHTRGVETATAPTAEAPSRPPLRELGEYELLERLGAGGMGEVYRARHRRLGKFVALKVLQETRLASPAALARFRREMEAVGQLDHPHLVEAHDAGEQDGVVYLVLKLIEGTDLQRLVQERGPLPAAEACELVRQAALGLQHLHERGLVHRDVKPANLMLAPSPMAAGGPPAAAPATGEPPVAMRGVVKVLDLGLARLRDSLRADELTAPDMLLGTPDYLAPEQIDNAAAVDARADLYGLGAALFYLLTGQAPFGHHAQTLAKLKAHGHETPPDVRTLRPEVPAGVAALVARLLAKRPEQRFATAQQLAEALAPFTTPAGTPSRPRPRRRPVLAVAAGLVLVPLVAWAMLSLVRRPPRPDPVPDTTRAGPVVRQPAPEVVRLDVEHFRDGNPLGLLGRKSFTTRGDDQVTVAGELSSPGYCYLVAYRPDGTEELCFPEEEDVPPPLTDRPRYPSVSLKMQIGLNEGPGLHAFVLVARSRPLPPYTAWRKQHGASPWKKSDAVAGVVWRCDGRELRAHVAEDPEARGKGKEARGAGALPELVEWLCRETEAEAVSAVAFAVRRRP
jgi:serine/threonine protein kinase